MNITEQDTFDTLKYGYIKPLTLIDYLEQIIPGVTRNFIAFYSNKILQESYNRGQRNLGEFDGKSYTKEIAYTLQNNQKYYKIGYEFVFLIEDFSMNNTKITMRTQVTNSCKDIIKYQCKKEKKIESKQHFLDLVVEWQKFIDDSIDNIISHLYQTTVDPNIGLKLRTIYHPPNSDPELTHTLDYNKSCWAYDVDHFILKIDEIRDTLKSFG